MEFCGEDDLKSCSCADRPPAKQAGNLPCPRRGLGLGLVRA
jgi:hypothetical protein